MASALGWYVRVALAACVGGVTAALAVPSYAGYAIGDVRYLGCYEGHCYDNRSDIYTNYYGYQAIASEIIYTDGGNNTPAGYMGDRARLFYNGAVCKQDNWNYNSTATNYMVVNAGDGHTTACGAGVYYSQYDTAVWDNGAYVVFSAYPSPNQNAS